MSTWFPSFWFKIDSIRSTSAGADLLNGFWRPPCERSAFETITGSGLHRWTNGTLTPCPRNNLPMVSVASVFYQSDTQRFLAMPTDCRVTIMNGAGHGWRQVGFEYRNDNNISILGCEVANSQTVLAAPASSNAWMPQLLPAIYNRTPDLDTPEHDDPGGLAGSLALLIALAAYSTEPANMIAGIGHSFQVPVWRPHNWRHGSKLAQKP